MNKTEAKLTRELLQLFREAVCTQCSGLACSVDRIDPKTGEELKECDFVLLEDKLYNRILKAEGIL